MDFFWEDDIGENGASAVIHGNFSGNLRSFEYKFSQFVYLKGWYGKNVFKSLPWEKQNYMLQIGTNS